MNDSFRPRSRSRRGGLLVNLVTLIAFLGTVCLGVAFAAVFVNPQLPFNPFPPPTLPPTLGFPTATNTPEISLPATPSPVAEVQPSATDAPTIAPSITEQPKPTDEPTIAPTASGPYFGLQPGSPVGIPNIANDQGCNWMGVGGQVFDLQSAPVTPGMIVHIEGTLGAATINLDTLTGSATTLGTAGYVFNLDTSPVASEGTLWIQLADSEGGGLSDKVFLTTYASCEQNLLLVNWRQVR